MENHSLYNHFFFHFLRKKKMVRMNILLKRQLPFEWIVLPEAIAKRPENLQWVEKLFI